MDLEADEVAGTHPSNRSGIAPTLFPVAGAFSPERLRVAVVGTYPPRMCGIATFTSDVVEQLGAFHPEVACDVYALDRRGSALPYDRLRRVIRVDDEGSFPAAAEAINASAPDAVWIQHEFGIFGDDDGQAVCGFAAGLAAPLLVTFHTVLAEPSERQMQIMRYLVSRASRSMVMSEDGRRRLIDIYRANAATVEVIQHGAPDRPFGRSAEFKARLALSDRPVLMTFGLLGPGKGIEQVIEAMPSIAARRPQVVYRIVGATHPTLLATEGEAYRERLTRLAKTLGVDRHVVWDNRFLETAELLDQLEACDVYVTPYLNLEQSTSGTLSYAVALGKAVVSTPYLHARELLSDGIGMLVPPRSNAAIASAVIDLLDDPAKLELVQRRAYERGRATIWPEFARASADLLRAAAGPRRGIASAASAPGTSAVIGMSDDTGILQHAIGVIPDRRHGYCLDDNARALMLMNVVSGLEPARQRHLSRTYASFVQHAWNDQAGRFRNFMRFDRSWCEEVGSDDSNGRALWAIGHTVELSGDADLRAWALPLFQRVSSSLLAVTSPRAVAFMVLGAGCVLRGDRLHPEARVIAEVGGDYLTRLLAAAESADWTWFESVLGYDNPRLPQALIEAGTACRRKDWIDDGVRSLTWLSRRQTAPTGKFRPVGCESFGLMGRHLPFDQQPLEAQAAIEAAEIAYGLTGDTRWLDHANAAYAWFFGSNDRHVSLVDVASGACRDGVTPRGRNENCGAESILAFQLAYYSIRRLWAAAQAQARPALPLS